MLDNYETAEGVSLPRSTLYNHYLQHCTENKIDPMNPASFGKLIRSVFLGLRTRRLGTRGNSKYHYYGIRIKASSNLHQFPDEQTMAMRQTPMTQAGKKFKGSGAGGVVASGTDLNPDNVMTGIDGQHQQYLGDHSAGLSPFEGIKCDNLTLPEGVTMHHVHALEELYKEHAEAILDVVVNLQFALVERLWQQFWRNTPPNQAPTVDADDDEERLPKNILYALCKLEPVQKFVKSADYAFYQVLVEVLIPDVLRPIPSSLTQAIRNFAKNLEGWLRESMTGVHEGMTSIRCAAVSALAQTLRRYTSLNHLAQAARAVLQNTQQIQQMLSDLNRVDLNNVQEQASWVCMCPDTVVERLHQDFKNTLQQNRTLEEWAQWLENVVRQQLHPYDNNGSADQLAKVARHLLLKWSFYSSMIIRDLTLRSAASFGSFHLIRLLYDEYMFYLVEHRVAQALDDTPIAVMAELKANQTGKSNVVGATPPPKRIKVCQQ